MVIQRIVEDVKDYSEQPKKSGFVPRNKIYL